MTIWHYAVKVTTWVMQPACAVNDTTSLLRKHTGTQGITIVRGRVNCDDCKEAMGMR